MKRVLIENEPRKKLLNFRLSAEESDLLLESARITGARSVSEYVRSVVMESARRDCVLPAGRTLTRSHLPSGDGGELAEKLQNALAALENAIRTTRQEISKR